MKNLKRFDELNTETYKSAASRLGALGFYDRQKAINAYVDKSYAGYIYEIIPGTYFKLVNEWIIINGKHYKEGDEEFIENDFIVFDIALVFVSADNDTFKIKFQIILSIKENTISVHKNSAYDDEDIALGKRVGYLIKKNILSNIFDRIPLSEIFMINDYSSIEYKKVVDTIENINLNDLCSSKNMYLLRKTSLK